MCLAFQNGVKNIQTASYNGARTIYSLSSQKFLIIVILCIGQDYTLALLVSLLYGLL